MILSQTFGYDTPTGLSAGLTAIAAIALLWAIGEASRSPTSRTVRAVLGGLILIIAVAVGGLLAGRISIDAIDLSESAARQVSGELRWFFAAIGIAALAIGIGVPKVLGGLARSDRPAHRFAIAIAGLIAITLVGSFASMLLLSPVVDSAGLSRITMITAIALAAALGTLHAAPWNIGPEASQNPRRYVWIMFPAMIIGTWLIDLASSHAAMVCTLALMGYATVRFALDQARSAQAINATISKKHLPLAACAIGAALLLVPAALHLSTLGLAWQARNHVEARPPKAPADAPVYAVCVAPERFAVVIPGMGDGGNDLIVPAILIDRSQFASAQDLAHLERGTVIPASPVGADLNARRFELKARVAHGDHFHDYDFAVVNAQKADMRELALSLGAHAGNIASLIMIAFGSMLATVMLRERVRWSGMLTGLFISVLAALVGASAVVGGLIGIAAAIVVMQTLARTSSETSPVTQAR
ncbi:MAG: hypothetical protein K2W85_10750 [Phycisphaerales bacterium]|nr:hypothetical protein [Phycisphaerales bacterium]